MPRKKPHDFLPEDKEWYESRIPNPITRNLAIKLHKELGWDNIYEPLQNKKRGVFGVSKARDGEKNDIAYLLALELTGATSLVAVCDKVEGFSKKGSDTVTGRQCDIYVNGKKIKKVDNIVGDAIQSDFKTKSLGGRLKKDEVVEMGVKVAGVRRGKKAIPILEGLLTLNSDIDTKKPLALAGTHPVEIGPKSFKVKGEFIIPIKEKTDKDGAQVTFPCRITHPRIDKKANVMRVKRDDPERPYTTQDIVQDTVGFNCVNWAKILDRDEASLYNIAL